jgi:formamidopyrimidine-DNA glycosylase
MQGAPMPELPEIYQVAQQMQKELPGKIFDSFEIIQPKCLNISPKKFVSALNNARITEVTYHGKWICVNTSHGWLLLCLGMGGEILLVNRTSLPEKYRLIFDFKDGSCLAINFWWFGYSHFTAKLADHKMTAQLGPNAIDVDAACLQEILKKRKGVLKTFLLDQKRIAGIGNFYIHDILFKARLHPLRPVQSLSDAEIRLLHKAIQDRLLTSIRKGGASYEQNLYGQKGGFSMKDLIIGYKEGKPCPKCGTDIQKIKTGSTSGFICTKCQPL